MSSQRSLVLGFAAGLPAQSFLPFAASLRASGFRGRFGLITAQCTPSDRADLAELADLHWDVDDRFLALAASPTQVRALRWLCHTPIVRRGYDLAFQACARVGSERTSQERWERLEYELQGLQSLRYALYLDFIRGLAPDADLVMVSDLRDVYFQSDPLAGDIADLELFLEEPVTTLGEDPFNRRWIRDLYGRSAVARMADDPISCCGTVVGRRASVERYLERMADAVRWRRRPLGGYDQGIHNFLLRTGRIPDATLVANGYGRVLTMALMRQLRVDNEGRVVNHDGTIPAALHQYDRHPELAFELRQRVGVSAEAPHAASCPDRRGC